MNKVHSSLWLVIIGVTLIVTGLLFVPVDADQFSVPLRLIGNLFLGTGVVWAIIHFGRTR